MTCTTCAAISAATEPHVMWGGVAIAGIALVVVLGSLSGDSLFVALLLMAVIGVGMAVDVVAHGYQH